MTAPETQGQNHHSSEGKTNTNNTSCIIKRFTIDIHGFDTIALASFIQKVSSTIFIEFQSNGISKDALNHPICRRASSHLMPPFFFPQRLAAPKRDRVQFNRLVTDLSGAHDQRHLLGKDRRTSLASFPACLRPSMPCCTRSHSRFHLPHALHHDACPVDRTLLLSLPSDRGRASRPVVRAARQRCDRRSCPMLSSGCSRTGHGSGLPRSSRRLRPALDR